MFSRGKATYGTPICSGTRMLEKPTNSGVANSSSMMLPCIVNIWLYCALLRNCIPGLANSPRIANAITPPMMKNTNDVMR